MDIKDNKLLRQYEFNSEQGRVVIEYAQQDRKLFLTKIINPENVDEKTVLKFIETILEEVEENNWKVVPTYPKIVSYFRKKPSFKSLLPPGIKI